MANLDIPLRGEAISHVKIEKCGTMHTSNKYLQFQACDYSLSKIHLGVQWCVIVKNGLFCFFTLHVHSTWFKIVLYHLNVILGQVSDIIMKMTNTKCLTVTTFDKFWEKKRITMINMQNILGHIRPFWLTE